MTEPILIIPEEYTWDADILWEYVDDMELVEREDANMVFFMIEDRFIQQWKQ